MAQQQQLTPDQQLAADGALFEDDLTALARRKYRRDLNKTLEERCKNTLKDNMNYFLELHRRGVNPFEILPACMLHSLVEEYPDKFRNPEYVPLMLTPHTQTIEMHFPPPAYHRLSTAPPLDKLCQDIKSVCARSLKRLIMDWTPGRLHDECWIEIDLKRINETLSEEPVRDMICGLPNLTDIKLLGKMGDSAMGAIASTCTKLESLVCPEKATDSGVREVCDGCPLLKHLDVKHCRRNMEKVMFHALTTLEHLESIEAPRTPLSMVMSRVALRRGSQPRQNFRGEIHFYGRTETLRSIVTCFPNAEHVFLSRCRDPTPLYNLNAVSCLSLEYSGNVALDINNTLIQRLSRSLTTIRISVSEKHTTTVDLSIIGHTCLNLTSLRLDAVTLVCDSPDQLNRQEHFIKLETLDISQASSPSGAGPVGLRQDVLSCLMAGSNLGKVSMSNIEFPEPTLLQLCDEARDGEKVFSSLRDLSVLGVTWSPEAMMQLHCVAPRLYFCSDVYRVVDWKRVRRFTERYTQHLVME